MNVMKSKPIGKRTINNMLCYDSPGKLCYDSPGNDEEKIELSYLR